MVLPFWGFGPWGRSPESYGYSVCSKLGNNFGWLEFNCEKIDNHESVRVTAGHEFFHLVQSLYDSRNPIAKASDQPEHLWLNETMSVWIEENFSDDQNFISELLLDEFLEPYYGMHVPLADGKSASQEHGYGMSSMIKYLTKVYGRECPVKIYEQIHKGKHHVKAIASATDWPSRWLA